MSTMLRAMATAAYAIFVSMQFSFGGGPSICPPPLIVGPNGCFNPGPITISVPEPTALAVFATGLGILAWARHRRRK